MTIPSDATIDAVLKVIKLEYVNARRKFAPFNGGHEGYAIILEEVEELWDTVKQNQPERAKQEAIQVAAMALAFLLEVK